MRYITQGIFADVRFSGQGRPPCVPIFLPNAKGDENFASRCPAGL
jgi:hypothetical protein